MTPSRSVAVAGCLLAFLAGCSFAMSSPAYRPPDPPRCHATRAAPIADSIVAIGVGGTATLTALTTYLRDDCPDADNAGENWCHNLDDVVYLTAALLMIPTAVYTGAAVVGFRRAGRCREAMAEHERRRAIRASHAGHGARVLLVAALGPSRSNVERALLAGEPIDHHWLTPQEFDERVSDGRDFGRYAVIVLVNHDPLRLPSPPLPVMTFRVGGAGAPIPPKQSMPSVRVDQVGTGHPALRGVSLVGATLETVSSLAVDPSKDHVALAAEGPHVVIAATSSADGRVIACGFDPERTAWARGSAFAAFVHAAVDWLADGQ